MIRPFFVHNRAAAIQMNHWQRHFHVADWVHPVGWRFRKRSRGWRFTKFSPSISTTVSAQQSWWRIARFHCRRGGPGRRRSGFCFWRQPRIGTSHTLNHFNGNDSRIWRSSTAIIIIIIITVAAIINPMVLLLQMLPGLSVWSRGIRKNMHHWLISSQSTAQRITVLIAFYNHRHRGNFRCREHTYNWHSKMATESSTVFQHVN